MNPTEKKLNLVLQQNEMLMTIVATLIRTMESKGVFSRQDFSRCAAFGKSMDLDKLIFGLGKK